MSPASPRKPPTRAASASAGRIYAKLSVPLREERIRRGWTLRQVADRARVSRTTVHSAEAGETTSLDVVARLAGALGLSLEV